MCKRWSQDCNPLNVHLRLLVSTSFVYLMADSFLSDAFNEHTLSFACGAVLYVILHSDAQLFKRDQRAKTFIAGGG